MWSSSSGHWNLVPSSVLKTKAKNALNTSAFSMSLFGRWTSSSSNGLMLFLLCLLPLIYLTKTFFYFPLQVWPTSALGELWPHQFCPYSGKQHLGILLMSPHLASTDHTHSLIILLPKKRPLLRQVGLLPFLFDLQHLGIARFSALRRWCL